VVKRRVQPADRRRTYTVTASGGGLGGTVTYNNVVIGSENVKRDFTPDTLDTDFATIADGKLTVLGTGASDSISITKDATAYTITRNGTATTLNATGVTSIDVYADDGDDYILIGSGVTLGAYVVAQRQRRHPGRRRTRHDHRRRRQGQSLRRLGDDRVNGNGGHDRLAGEHGRDRIYGGDGDDIMEGGSLPDRLWGEAGNNVYYGHGGDDKFYSRNGAADSLYGGLGNDAAQIDVGLDTHETVEELLA
jgi:Ca2+-binding RTX toxin-like protein